MRNAVYHFQSIKARNWKNNVLVKSGSARILSLRSHLILGAPLALALSYFLGSAARARAHVLGVALRAALPGARAQQCSAADIKGWTFRVVHSSSVFKVKGYLGPLETLFQLGD